MELSEDIKKLSNNWLLSEQRDFDMEIIFAIVIAVVGWIANHVLSIRAQNKAFLNQIINNARIDIVENIKEYLQWLGEIFKEISEIKAITPFNMRTVNFSWDYSDRMNRVFMLFRRYFIRPSFITRLDEYEPLFPNLKEARIYLGQKHLDMYMHFKQLVDTYETQPKSYEKLKEFEKEYDPELAGAQWVAVNDLLICLQNITLGKITGNKSSHPVYPMTKHPRIISDAKGHLDIIEFGDSRYPQDEISLLFDKGEVKRNNMKTNKPVHRDAPKGGA